MTDDHKNSVEKQPQNGQQQNISSKPQPVAATGSNTPSATVKTTIPEPQIKKVDIAIAGVTYPIYCPVHEQEELLSAVSYINNHALDLKRDAPSLSQESILVLCCLNLYEKIHTNQRSDEDRLQQDKQSEALLNKIMKDAQSVL
ncbi:MULTISPECIES: cell division protein ZapA [unclassified Psychrobacter]|uniref:cell division protein ZapA n=1 Tax=Psychrobacter TaxID=497 RepID=UPI0007132FD0|nr:MULTISPECIES: cell division protein ZapA [unclassified Psychrobacter]KRG32248.1 cell division protein ZapA [Psychrobacter sp. P11F6]